MPQIKSITYGVYTLVENEPVEDFIVGRDGDEEACVSKALNRASHHGNAWIERSYEYHIEDSVYWTPEKGC